MLFFHCRHHRHRHSGEESGEITSVLRGEFTFIGKYGIAKGDENLIKIYSISSAEELLLFIDSTGKITNLCTQHSLKERAN